MGQKSKQKQSSNVTKEKTISANACPYFENCDVRLGRAEYIARFQALIHLGVRLIYTIIAWSVLAKGVSSTSFFVSLFLFVVPVLMDCVQFGFAGWSRKWIVCVELGICVLWLVFASLGLAGIFVISLNEEMYIVSTASDFIGFQIPTIQLQSVWRFLGSIVFITGVDFACRYAVKIGKESRNYVQ